MNNTIKNPVDRLSIQIEKLTDQTSEIRRKVGLIGCDGPPINEGVELDLARGRIKREYR